MQVLKRTLLSLVALLATAATNVLADDETAADVAPAVHKTASEMGYRIEVAECDIDLNFIAVSSPDRQVKSQGSIVRICFRPNEKARDDGIGMRAVESFLWEMDHKDGTSLQVAVKDGKDDGMLSYLECQEGSKVCVLDTLLGANFYVNTGSVQGTGVAHLTFGSEPIEIEKWLFQADFKIRFTSEGGEEMSEEDQAVMMQRLKEQEQEAAAAAAAPTPEGEDVEL
jgi:hypothetical protein